MMELFTDVLPHLFGSGNPIFFINGNVAGHFGQGANGAWSWDSIVDYFRHLTMPILALSVQLIADWSRYQRSTMVEALQGDYMRTAISKGMSRKRAYFRHGLRNATLPMVSVFALDIGLLFSGFVITETVFSIHGMGLVFVSALQEGDATLLLAWTMLTALAIILFNLLADLILPIVDPRVRTQ
jgi:peptide/nickel transport system permease protein